MITIYSRQHGHVSAVCPLPGAAGEHEPVWIDIVNPSRTEREDIARLFGVELPDYEDLHEIEASSRVYRDGPVAYLTAPLLANADRETPQVGPFCFILTPRVLMTLRFHEPYSVKIFAGRLDRDPTIAETPLSTFVWFLDTIVDRAADVLELLADRVDRISRRLFAPPDPQRAPTDLKQMIREVGMSADALAKARDSLSGLSRVVSFARGLPALQDTLSGTLRSLEHDLESLTEHADYINSRIGFLLDATVGAITIEQNNIVKIFSVAAVTFMPPTLVASIYGMNYKLFPDNEWPLGFPFAILLMVLSAIVPLWYFKRRGWL